MSTVYRFSLSLKDSLWTIDEILHIFERWAEELGVNKEAVEHEHFKKELSTVTNISFRPDINTLLTFAQGQYGNTDEESTFGYELISQADSDDEEFCGHIYESGCINLKEHTIFCKMESLDEQAQYPFSNFAYYLMKKGYLRKNLGFRVSDRAIPLRYDDAEMIAGLLKGDVDSDLPVVLLRETDIDPQFIIDCAPYPLTVMYEIDPDMFKDLETYDIGDNFVPGPGSIAIITPHFCRGILTIDADDIQDCEEKEQNSDISTILLDAIYESIETKCADTKVLEPFLDVTHNGLTDLADTLQDKAYRALDVCGQLKELNKKLKGDIAKMQYMNIPKANVPSELGVIIHPGKEKDLYEGEIRDMIISSLKEYREKYVQDGSRRADILDDILSVNTSSGICAQKKKEFEEVLGNLKEINSPSTINKLEKLGFIVKHGTHLKLKWYDPRYTFTVATTPSDNRAQENMVHSIIKLFL